MGDDPGDRDGLLRAVLQGRARQQQEGGRAGGLLDAQGDLHQGVPEVHVQAQDAHGVPLQGVPHLQRRVRRREGDVPGRRGGGGRGGGGRGGRGGGRGGPR